MSATNVAYFFGREHGPAIHFIQLHHQVCVGSSGHVLIKPQDAGHHGSWQEQNQFIFIPIPINVLLAIKISPEDDCSFLPAIGGSTGARLG